MTLYSYYATATCKREAYVDSSRLIFRRIFLNLKRSFVIFRLMFSLPLRNRQVFVPAGMKLTPVHSDSGSNSVAADDSDPVPASTFQISKQMTFLGRKFFTSLQLNVLLFRSNGEAHFEMEKVAETACGGDQDIQEDTQNSLLQTDALYKYILETSVYPREPEHMKELRLLTAQHPLGYMAISADGGQFLNMLLKLINAKKTMEIGVFTGYSLLATALALPPDGQTLALDINKENYNMGLPVIEKAGVAHKIDFRQEPALPFLDLLLQDEKNHGSFDFVFVDADKSNYINYHKRIIELVKVGGVIAYDNTLWYGSVVAPPEAPMEDFIRFNRGFVMEFNKAIGEDPRIEICMLPVGDGITICRRIE